MVTTTLSDRSYIINSQRKEYRRNRLHLRPGTETATVPSISAPVNNEPVPPRIEPAPAQQVQSTPSKPIQPTGPATATATSQYVTRSGRANKPPSHMKHFQT